MGLLQFFPEEKNDLAKTLLNIGWLFLVCNLVGIIRNIDLTPYGKLRNRKDGKQSLDSN